MSAFSAKVIVSPSAYSPSKKLASAISSSPFGRRPLTTSYCESSSALEKIRKLSSEPSTTASFKYPYSILRAPETRSMVAQFSLSIP